MAWGYRENGFDFRLSDLKYKVGGCRQYFSSEGGVFSFDHKNFDYERREHYDPENEEIRFNNEVIAGRIIFSHSLEIYDGPKKAGDGERLETEHEHSILSDFAEAIRLNYPFSDEDYDCEILFFEISASLVKKLPDLGSEVTIVDKNKQSISSTLVGVNLSKSKGGAVCLFMLKGEQTRVVIFANEGNF